MPEIEKRLQDAAPVPRSAPDVEGAWRKGRKQRAIRQTTAGLLATVLVGVGAWGALAMEREEAPPPTTSESTKRFRYDDALEIGTVYQPQAILPGGEGWFMSFTEPPHAVGSEDRNWAWASTHPLRGDIEKNPFPEEALQRLPEDGIFIEATAHLTSRQDSSIPRRNLPFQLTNTTVSEEYEGQVRLRQPVYTLEGRVGEYTLGVFVKFGSSPTADMMRRAQEQLDLLYIRPGLREVAYNGSPLPDEAIENHFSTGTIELPVGWQIYEPTTSPPTNFVAANYSFDPSANGCERGGLFSSMPSDGVAIVGYANPGLSVDPRPEHVTLDPITYASYEGWGCMPSYRIDMSTAHGPLSLLVFFRDEGPSSQSLALTLRAIDSLSFD